jgi:hypothetical protein
VNVTHAAYPTLYVLTCDTQNEHGYVDTDVLGVYPTEAARAKLFNRLM